MSSLLVIAVQFALKMDFKHLVIQTFFKLHGLF